MSILTFVFFVFPLLSQSFSFICKTPNDTHVEHTFATFISEYKREYANDEEYKTRKNIFRNHLAFIEDHNTHREERGLTFVVDINHLADRTEEEIGTLLGRRETLLKLTEPSPPSLVVPPKSMDWRKDSVSPIKNQEQCGSCWAFSTIASVESAWKIKKGTLYSLSEQQLMDCSRPEGDQSCRGGLMDDAFQYIIDNQGVCQEVDYPYVAQDSTCKTECQKVVHLSGFKDIPPNNENEMILALSNQPVSVAIEADQPSFQFYSSGVYNDKSCGTQLDHGVNLVGYTPTYWILRNSWGTTWGQEGYMYLARGTGGSGICGVLSDASYPVV